MGFHDSPFMKIPNILQKGYILIPGGRTFHNMLNFIYQKILFHLAWFLEWLIVEPNNSNL